MKQEISNKDVAIVLSQLLVAIIMLGLTMITPRLLMERFYPSKWLSVAIAFSVIGLYEAFKFFFEKFRRVVEEIDDVD